MLNYLIPKMKRNHSNPPNAKIESSEELKELFTDPGFFKEKNPDVAKEKKGNSTNQSTGKSAFPDVEVATPAVKVADPVFQPVGNSIMARRITIAGGFLDIALFTANCEQLKFVLELGNFHIYYNHVLGLLITSLVLQLLVGLTFFLLGCQGIHKVKYDETYSNVLNHLTMGLVALITIVNIFINTFGPKGTVMARCLGAFAYPNTSGPMWMSYLNATRNYMTSDDLYYRSN